MGNDNYMNCPLLGGSFIRGSTVLECIRDLINLNPKIEHAQTWNLLNPRIVLLIPKISGLGMYDSILRFNSS